MEYNIGDKVRIVPNSSEIWEIIEIDSYYGIFQPNTITLKLEDIIIGASINDIVEVVRKNIKE